MAHEQPAARDGGAAGEQGTGRPRLFRNARLVTLDPAREGLGIVEDGAVLAQEGVIAFAGPQTELPRDAGDAAAEIVDCEGRWLTPGLVDCHTHLVHAGNRAGEFEQRLAGVSYEAIARSGGGILSTVRATRAASEGQLVATALPRLDALIAEGVTAVEIKSGYGLDLETEQRMLRAARQLADLRPVTIRTTFLGAHALPPEAASREAFIDDLCRRMLPAIAKEGLADAVDAFCEGIAFSVEEVGRVFAAARDLGLPVKLHADQLSDGGGAALAASFGALSADHLEYTGDEGVAAMAAAGTVALLLPGAFYFIRETQLPPIEAFRRHGVPMAVATDMNPGTSPLRSLLLAANMAATLFRLTVPECLAGITREAAKALGLAGQAGMLTPGAWCDLAIWDIETPADLVYRIGGNPLHRRIWRGE